MPHDALRRTSKLIVGVVQSHRHAPERCHSSRLHVSLVPDGVTANVCLDQLVLAQLAHAELQV